MYSSFHYWGCKTRPLCILFLFSFYRRRSKSKPQGCRTHCLQVVGRTPMKNVPGSRRIGPTSANVTFTPSRKANRDGMPARFFKRFDDVQNRVPHARSQVDDVKTAEPIDVFDGAYMTESCFSSIRMFQFRHENVPPCWHISSLIHR